MAHARSRNQNQNQYQSFVIDRRGQFRCFRPGFSVAIQGGKSFASLFSPSFLLLLHPTEVASPSYPSILAPHPLIAAGSRLAIQGFTCLTLSGQCPRQTNVMYCSKSRPIIRASCSTSFSTTAPCGNRLLHSCETFASRRPHRPNRDHGRFSARRAP